MGRALCKIAFCGHLNRGVACSLSGNQKSGQTRDMLPGSRFFLSFHFLFLNGWYEDILILMLLVFPITQTEPSSILIPNSRIKGCPLCLKKKIDCLRHKRKKTHKQLELGIPSSLLLRTNHKG